MTQSNEISDLAKALAAAQASLRPAEMTGENPAFKRDGKATAYATLADCWKAWQEVGPTNGLSITQTFSPGDNALWIHTTLFHSSGQWIASVLPMPFGANPQQTGSAISYGRRYALCAIAGIVSAEADDDANSASHNGQAQKTTIQSPKSQGKAHSKESGSYGSGFKQAVDDANKTSAQEEAVRAALKDFRQIVGDKGFEEMARMPANEVFQIVIAKLGLDIDLSKKQYPMPDEIRNVAHDMPHRLRHGAVITDPNAEVKSLIPEMDDDPFASEDEPEHSIGDGPAYN